MQSCHMFSVGLLKKEESSICVSNFEKFNKHPHSYGSYGHLRRHSRGEFSIHKEEQETRQKKIAQYNTEQKKLGYPVGCFN